MEKTTKQPKKLPKLKPKEKEFVKVLVRKNDENIVKTVQEVYGIKDYNYAHVKGHRMIQKDTVVKAIEIEKETLKSALEKQGITPSYIAEKVDVLLKATIGENEKPDINAIDKGLKHATNIYGVIDTEDKPKVNSTYNFIFNAETQQSVREINEIIKRKLINPDESI